MGEVAVDQIAGQGLVVGDAEILDLRQALRDRRLVEQDDPVTAAVGRDHDAEETHQAGPGSVLAVLQVDARILAGPVDPARMDRNACHLAPYSAACCRLVRT